MNVNTREYWNSRFQSHDWSDKGGNIQSQQHANYFVKNLGLPKTFAGSICDAGCAEGDAIPVYRAAWPQATLTGVDFAQGAIDLAREKYSQFGSFFSCDFEDVPESDVIIASHVFEHLDNHVQILELLRTKCSTLFIVVPFREDPMGPEHLRVYDEHTYDEHAPVRFTTCPAGWHVSGFSKLFNIDTKNIGRLLTGRRVVKMPMQIIFEFDGSKK